ncbi:MAG TPA: hypothetical protein VF962_07275 [Gemmatimonadaceae bacterium]
MRSISAVLFCGAVAAVTARTASAQAGSQVASATAAVAPASVVLLNGKPIGPAEPWSAKPVGGYDLVIPTGGSMIIASLTIAEVAGKLSATLVQLDNPDPVAMDVAVNGTDLVLTLNRPQAPITVHLQHRGPQLSGNWIVGTMDSGTVEGKVKL